MDGTSALVHFIRKENLKMVKALLDAGADGSKAVQVPIPKVRLMGLVANWIRVCVRVKTSAGDVCFSGGHASRVYMHYVNYRSPSKQETAYALSWRLVLARHRTCSKTSHPGGTLIHVAKMPHLP